MSGDDVVVVDPPAGFFRIDLRSLWEYRELLYFLVWRDLKLRYKQTAIGIGWVVLQPLATMVIFSVIFGRLARVPSDGLPYPVFVYSALLPWNYFATALNRCILSVVGEAHLISKIYFPRLLLPLAAPISGLVDFAVSLLQPLATMAIFSVICGRLARVPSDGLPYPVFVYSALLPWNYFATALNRCILSVVGEAHLISKIYFPRLLLPLAAPISGLVDFAVSLLLLLGMLAWYHL